MRTVRFQMYENVVFLFRIEYQHFHLWFVMWNMKSIFRSLVDSHNHCKRTTVTITTPPPPPPSTNAVAAIESENSNKMLHLCFYQRHRILPFRHSQCFHHKNGFFSFGDLPTLCTRATRASQCTSEHAKRNIHLFTHR